MFWRRAWQPTPVFLPGESPWTEEPGRLQSMGSQSLKRLSTHSTLFPTGIPGNSAGKEFACNAGDPSLIPGLGRSPGEGIGYPLQYSWASLMVQMVKKKKSANNVGDLCSIPELGKSPGEGKGYPLQNSGLEKSMDCIVDGITKSRTRLSDFHFHFNLKE